jgi:hypothetical protein
MTNMNKLFLNKFAADGIEYKPVVGSFLSGTLVAGTLKYLYNRTKGLGTSNVSPRLLSRLAKFKGVKGLPGLLFKLGVPTVEHGSKALQSVAKRMKHNKLVQKYEKRSIPSIALTGGLLHSGYAALNNVENAIHNKHLSELKLLEDVL